MNGSEFTKRLRRLGKQTGTRVYLDSKPGKGSHGRIYYGDRFTTIKDRKKEIGTGLLKAMLAQLGIKKEDF
jgi:predicted RNA binding protein YcfA (HicA-like mRNA interferase family)